MKPFARPDMLEGRTLKLNTPCGSLYTILNESEGELREIMLKLGKSGTCMDVMLRTVSILLSVMLQAGIPYENIKKALLHQFEGNCGQTLWYDGERYYSCMDFVVRRILEDLASREKINLEEE